MPLLHHYELPLSSSWHCIKKQPQITRHYSTIIQKEKSMSLSIFVRQDHFERYSAMRLTNVVRRWIDKECSPPSTYLYRSFTSSSNFLEFMQSVSESVEDKIIALVHYFPLLQMFLR